MKIIQPDTQPVEDLQETQPIEIDKDLENEVVTTSDAIKRHILITYDADGKPDKSKIQLGVQWDHRVTWLSFDFTQYIWNTNSKDDDDYTDENKYDKYKFKIMFKLGNTDTIIYQLDPLEAFEVPREVTKRPGSYQMAVVIEEIPEELDGGNVPYRTEVYVTKTITCVVEDTWFTPEFVLLYYDADTSQKKALTKRWIDGKLSKEGTFRLNSKNFGSRADSYVKYIRFNTENFPVELQNLSLFVGFFNPATGDRYFSRFEDADPEDAYDNYEEGFPKIAWIPNKVTENESTWDVIILGYAGIYEDIRHNYVLDDEEYIFYCSKTFSGCNVKGFVSQDDLAREIDEWYLLYTADDEQFIDSEDNEILVPGGND